MTIREFYEAIHGDYDDMASRMPREELIERFIMKFADSDVFGTIMQNYEDKDYEALFNSTHLYKGMAANMSFKALCSVVSDICEEVRHGAPEHDLGPMIDRLKDEHDAFVSAYDRYIREK